MDYPRLTLDELVDDLRTIMQRHGLREAYVFGSRVRGDHLHRSDFDVLIVDERYEGVPFLERGTELLREWPHVTPELELFCYTPLEFARGNTIIRAALRQGIRVVLEDQPLSASASPNS